MREGERHTHPRATCIDAESLRDVMSVPQGAPTKRCPLGFASAKLTFCKGLAYSLSMLSPRPWKPFCSACWSRSVILSLCVVRVQVR